MNRPAPPLDPGVRAEILRVVLLLGGGLPDVSLDQSVELALRHLTERDVDLLGLASDEDLALVNACLALERELRESEFAAVERLLAIAAGSEGALDYRLRKLPLREFAQAASCLYVAGWIGFPDES